MFDRLLKSLHSPFDKSPHAKIALRVQHPDIFRWTVNNRVLSVGTEASENTTDFNLASLTLNELADALTNSGFQVVYQDSELSSRSSAILLSGSGSQSQSNGDALRVYESLLWSLMDSYATELEIAAGSIDQALLQMYLDTAQSEWLDYWGEYFGFPREGRTDAEYSAYIIEEVLRPRNNAFAIEDTIKRLTQENVHIYEPWKDIFVLSGSKLNDRYHLHGAHYYTFATIQPVGNAGINWGKVIPLIKRNKAGGIMLAEARPLVPPAYIDAGVIDSIVSASETRVRVARIKLEMDSPLSAYRLDFDTYIKNYPFMAYGLMTLASEKLAYVADIPNPRTIAKASICLSDSWSLGNTNSVFGRGRIIRIMPGMTLSGGATEDDDLRLSDGVVTIIYEQVEEIIDDRRVRWIELLAEAFALSTEMTQTGYAFLPITNNPASIDILYTGLVELPETMFMFSAEMIQTGYAFLPITNNPASIDILYAVLIDSGHDADRRWVGKWDSSTWVEGVDELLITTQLTVIGDMGLFVNNEQGFWYDPSDFSTMFQDSAGTIPVTSVGQSVGRILDKSGNGNHATQATTSKKPILKRMPTSGIRNLVPYSGDFFIPVANGGGWNTTASWSQVEVNPLHAGDKAYQVTNDGVSSSRNFNASLGVSTGTQDTLSVIVEVDPNAPESNKHVSIGIYSSTTSSFYARTNYFYPSNAVVSVAGSGYAEILSENGPNGGRVVRIVCSGITPVGYNRSRYVYPTGTDQNTRQIIIHSAQYEIGIEAATAYQQTFGNYDVYEAGYNQVYWLDYDDVDDALVSTNPDLGTNATRARATIGGAVIEQGLTLGANLNLSTDNLGLIVINRPLTQDELSALTSYLNSIVGS
ncbi:hypothetical protein SAMN05428952_100994 [Nitrosomonas sp. Nm132]|nr:hypothetical protein SAMN05428952_100994 [Nitrosomonas sp. Nm132]